MKKYLLENGDEENRYAVQVAKYGENPVEDEDEKKKEESASDASDSSSGSDDDSDASSSDGKPKKKEEKPAAKPKAEESSEESDSGSSGSSSSSSSSSDDSDSDGQKHEESDDDEEEQVKKGELPKKYAFLALPREEMTAAQRRWRWVRYECLPDDMKPFFVDPNKKKKEEEPETKKKDTKTKGGDQPNPDAKATEEKPEEIGIVDDAALDFTVKDNVERILVKYRKQLSVSRRNYDPVYNISVL